MTAQLARWALVLVVTLGVAVPQAGAEVRTKTIEYKDGDTVLKGLLAWDDSASGKRPGVLVVHEWWASTTTPRAGP